MSRCWLLSSFGSNSRVDDGVQRDGAVVPKHGTNLRMVIDAVVAQVIVGKAGSSAQAAGLLKG